MLQIVVNHVFEMQRLGERPYLILLIQLYFGINQH